MPYRRNSAIIRGCAALAALALCAPLGATVRDGVDAWSRGDYDAAVAEWVGPAEAGDPDAMFNMGQAYRLGRGVPADMQRAEQFYKAAAEAGHIQAADTYGLMLFQDGRREEALPYVLSASQRGDPRAQYLLGIAHFNGDMVERDWERAYALLTLANATGLPQAGPAIEQMDSHIPLDQRQAGVALARMLESEAQQSRSVQLAAADLSAAREDPVPEAATPVVETAASRPIAAVAVSPSVVAARDAVAQARQATGTSNPAEAGASYAQGSAPTAAPAPEPVEVAETVSPAPAPADAAPESAPAQAAASGPWRVQLGAFGVDGNAERLWNRLSHRPEIAGRERLFLPRGRVTVVQAGGFATRADAQAACSSLQRAGQECLVTRN
ncbi:SPOR domain-containing protein [Aurantiacibacter hainanensis]|uniref:SPOR domain-containing protein n=1 Tax=Aurantiacibacter hainanensis TaxID=3076114 RepID=UPI0030C71E87